MLWLKAIHIIFMVAWFAGLFYLPRLFVYHADTRDSMSVMRFKIMERRLFYGIMLPSALLTILFGFWMIYLYPEIYRHANWMHIKLCLVFLLVLFHMYCGKLYYDFKHDRNQHSSIFYRWLNEVPTVLLITIVIVTVIKPA